MIARFAPSPTGYLHLGHAYSAMLNYAEARAAGGQFLLRIEDIDRTRCRAEYTEAIFEDMAWLGVKWEEPVWVQSQRLPFYEKHLAELQARGLVYRCFKTRKDIQEAMSAPHDAPMDAFRGKPLAAQEEQDRLGQGQAFAWRLSLTAAEAVLGDAFAALSFLEETDAGMVKKSAEPARFGDVVLARKDIGTSYHLASILDDAAQGVTHVIRGEDLRDAAGIHVLLYALFGFAPPIYRHHKLIGDATGQRLAKRNKSATLRAMRAAGEKPPGFAFTDKNWLFA